METSKLLVVIASYVIILFTLIPLIRQDYWIFRIFEYPRLQKLLVSSGLLILYLLTFGITGTHDKILAALLLANTVYLLYQVIPFTFLAARELHSAKESSPERQISLFIGNVYQYNRNIQGYVSCIRSMDPDVLMLVETDDWWAANLKVVNEAYPHQLSVPLNNTYGMMLFSKLELQNAQIKYLVDEDVPSVHACIKLPSGELIDFHGLHPTPPVPQENPRSTERDKEILLVGESAKRSDKPVIVAGDLNDVAWSYTTDLFSRISGLLDPRKGRGFFNTFHARYFFMRFPLDHIFCSNDFTLIDIRRMPACGSDHFPMYIKLQYSPAEAGRQEEPQADPGDKQTAKEKIQKPT